MRVFLTGATGLVGSHTAARLRRNGHDVVALVRSTSETSFLDTIGVAYATGDLSQTAERLAEAMAGCDALVHAAAIVLKRGSWPLYHRVNVEGTEHVLRAAGVAGVRRVVHVSSVAVYGGAGARRRVTEEEWRAEPIPPNDFYSRSKREAEELAWRLHDQGLVRVTTVRPAVIYGERDRLFTPWLARLVSLPLLPLPGGGHNTVPVVYAGNVAEGIVAALEREAAVGRAYNLSEDAPITPRALVEGFARALGRRPRLLAIPPAMVRAFARGGDALLGWLPGVARPRLRRAARLLLEDNPYDASRARRELGWTAVTAHDEALARTAEWWREFSGSGSGASPLGSGSGWE